MDAFQRDLVALLPRLRRFARSLTRDVAGLPLGILLDQEYQSQTVSLAPGDILLAFTDGITEAMSPEHEIYGRDRVLNVMAKQGEGIDPMIDALMSDVEKFADGIPNRDDICITGLHRITILTSHEPHDAYP